MTCCSRACTYCSSQWGTADAEINHCIENHVYSHCCNLRVMKIPFDKMVFQMMNQMWPLHHCIDDYVYSHCCSLRVMKIPFDKMVFQMIDQIWPLHHCIDDYV